MKTIYVQDVLSLHQGIIINNRFFGTLRPTDCEPSWLSFGASAMYEALKKANQKFRVVSLLSSYLHLVNTRYPITHH